MHTENLSRFSIKRKPIWLLLVGLLGICGLLGFVFFGEYVVAGYNLARAAWNKPQFKPITEAANMALPSVESKAPVWLGVLVKDPDEPSEKQNLWVVEFSEQGIQPKQIAVFKEPSGLVDCTQIPATLCAVSRRRKDGVDTLYRYNVLSSEIISETIDIPADLMQHGAYVFALTNQGKILTDCCTKSIYFQSADSIKTIFKFTNDCISFQLSPVGDQLAVLCLKSWPLARMTPFEETEQHLYLVRLDGSQTKILETPPTYYFHERTVSDFAYPRPGIPDFEWSQDGKEIIFAASFSPPHPKTFGDWVNNVVFSRGAEWVLYGGVYSSDLESGSLTQWAEVGGWYPSLAWSPDRNYLAYTQEEQLSIASREGNYRQIGLPEGFALSDDTMRPAWVDWSPGGDYIVLFNWLEKDRIWVLATRDYVWRPVSIPMEWPVGIDGVYWISASAP